MEEQKQKAQGPEVEIFFDFKIRFERPIKVGGPLKPRTREHIPDGRQT